MPDEFGVQNQLTHALRHGTAGDIFALIERGADIHYEGDYRALLSSMFRKDLRRDLASIEIVKLLINLSVELNEKSRYSESALSVASNHGRFDLIRMLLDAGADPAPLNWNALHRAVALGTIQELQQQLKTSSKEESEQKDFWERTPWLLAIQAGDIEKEKCIRSLDINTKARGRCGCHPLQLAVKSCNPEMLIHLFNLGFDLQEVDDFGETALMEAAELGYLEMAQQLLVLGAQVDFRKKRVKPFENVPMLRQNSAHEKLWFLKEFIDDEDTLSDLRKTISEAPGINELLAEHESKLTDDARETALSNATDAQVIQCLLENGADPRQLKNESIRALLNLPGEPELELLNVSEKDFRAGKTRVFGSANPERMNFPYWIAMIRSGVSGYAGGQKYGFKQKWNGKQPLWSAARHGQSLTRIADGRVVMIAGEHEDSYDLDFCIYNDVFVFGIDGEIDIFGYPKKVFQPTDFHSATCVGDQIFIVGCLGYEEDRIIGKTPIYVLNTNSFEIREIIVEGEQPSWLHRHRAVLRGGRFIECEGGDVLNQAEGELQYEENSKAWHFDIYENAWKIVDKRVALIQ